MHVRVRVLERHDLAKVDYLWNHKLMLLSKLKRKFAIHSILHDNKL